MTFKLENSKGREHLADLGIEGRITDEDSTIRGHVGACL